MIPLASVDGSSKAGTGRNTFVYTQSAVNSAVFAIDPKRHFPRLITRKGGTATLSDFSEVIVEPSMQEMAVFVRGDSNLMNCDRERRAARQTTGRRASSMSGSAIEPQPVPARGRGTARNQNFCKSRRAKHFAVGVNRLGLMSHSATLPAPMHETPMLAPRDQTADA